MTDRNRTLWSRRLAPWGVSIAATLAGSTLALASTLTALAPVRVPDNPLGATSGCAALVAQQQALGSVNYPGAEVEPYVTVDPSNPQHLVGSFQQDRWNDGGSNGLTNVVSTNGGASWSLATGQPQFSTCGGAPAGSPGAFNRSTDPWVSFSSDGKTVYSIADSFNANGPGFGGASAILISRSTDGGTTWQTPVTARVDTSTQVLNDKESVTADPAAAGTAYAVWDQLVSPQSHANPSAFLHSISYRGPSLLSKTTDSGATWSTGRVIFDPGQNDQTIGNQLVVPTAGPGKGVLVDGFDLITNKGGICPFIPNSQCVGGSISTAAVIRSTDRGATWSAPIPIDRQQVGTVQIAGHPVRSSDELPEFTTNPVNGAIYAVWQDSRFDPAGASKIAFSQSSDGGLTWSPTIRIDQSPAARIDQSSAVVPAFVPQIHVTADGTIGLFYYDLENATLAKPGLTDAFVAHCHTATTDCTKPINWAAGGETKLTTSGSFDYTTAPDARGYFLGDYQGLANSGPTLQAFFGQARPQATQGRSDIFSSSAG